MRQGSDHFASDRPSGIDSHLTRINQAFLDSLERSPRVLTLFVPIGLLLLHCLYYMPFFSDDGFISLRYSQRLLEGLGLTWTEGTPVEGYSNLSWVLVVALLGSLGMDLIDGARLLGTVSMILVIVANHSLWSGEKHRAQRPYFAVAQLAFALSAPIAVWAIGGLEQSLVIACLAWAITFVAKYLEDGFKVGHLIVASIALGILCITRPDAPLFAACIALGMLLHLGWNQRSITACFVLAILPLIAFGGQLAFRLSYYGEWVPNPALVKVSPDLIVFSIGLLYVICGLLATAPFSYYAISVLRSDNARDEFGARTAILRTILVVWLAYLIFIGGDIFPAFRHLVPAVMVFALAFPMLGLCEKEKLQRLRFPYKMILLFTAVQFVNPASVLGKTERWEWDGQVISLALKKAFGDQQPLFAVSAAGCFPYFTGFPALDMLGINDYYLPRHPPEEKTYFAGHTLGDGRYVFDQEPDLIAFCAPGFNAPDKACWVGEEQLLAMPEFKEAYTAVSFEGTEPHTFRDYVWVRKLSEKVGIRRSSRQIKIPAYLLVSNTDGEPVARLDADDEFTISLQDNGSLSISGIPLPTGTRVGSTEALPASDDVDIKVTTQEGDDGAPVVTLDVTASSETGINHIVLNLVASSGME